MKKIVIDILNHLINVRWFLKNNYPLDDNELKLLNSLDYFFKKELRISFNADFMFTGLIKGEFVVDSNLTYSNEKVFEYMKRIPKIINSLIDDQELLLGLSSLSKNQKEYLLELNEFVDNMPLYLNPNQNVFSEKLKYFANKLKRG